MPAHPQHAGFPLSRSLGRWRSAAAAAGRRLLLGSGGGDRSPTIAFFFGSSVPRRRLRRRSSLCSARAHRGTGTFSPSARSPSATAPAAPREQRSRARSRGWDCRPGSTPQGVFHASETVRQFDRVFKARITSLVCNDPNAITFSLRPGAALTLPAPLRALVQDVVPTYVHSADSWGT